MSLQPENFCGVDPSSAVAEAQSHLEARSLICGTCWLRRPTRSRLGNGPQIKFRPAAAGAAQDVIGEKSPRPFDPAQKVLVHLDSRTVAMEVGTR